MRKPSKKTKRKQPEGYVLLPVGELGFIRFRGGKFGWVETKDLTRREAKAIAGSRS